MVFILFAPVIIFGFGGSVLSAADVQKLGPSQFNWKSQGAREITSTREVVVIEM